MNGFFANLLSKFQEIKEKLDFKTKDIVGLLLVLAAVVAFLIYITPPSETPSTNVLAIGPLSKQHGEVKVPIFSPVDLSYLSRSEIFRIRNEFVSQTPFLLSNEYDPTGEVFANMQSGLPWFSLYGFFFKGRSIASITGPSSESRYIANPFILVAPEFWGLSMWAPDGMKWDEKKIDPKLIKSPGFQLYCSPNEMVWNPEKSTASVTYLLSDYIDNLNKYNSTPLSKDKTYFGLIAYNARDFGFKYLAIDKNMSTNIVSSDEAEAPLQITDRIISMEHFCTNLKPCNHMDIPMLEADRIEIGPLPATVFIKLWYEAPASGTESPNMYFVLNFK